MTALTSAQIKKLNKMNRASADAVLGTRLAADEVTIAANTAVIAGSNISAGKYGVHTVTVTEASASSVAITTGITSVTGFMVQAYKSGSPLYATKVVNASGSLTITSSASSTWIMSGSEIINWLAW